MCSSVVPVVSSVSSSMPYSSMAAIELRFAGVDMPMIRLPPVLSTAALSGSICGGVSPVSRSVSSSPAAAGQSMAQSMARNPRPPTLHDASQCATEDARRLNAYPKGQPGGASQTIMPPKRGAISKAGTKARRAAAAIANRGGAKAAGANKAAAAAAAAAAANAAVAVANAMHMAHGMHPVAAAKQMGGAWSKSSRRVVGGGGDGGGGGGGVSSGGVEKPKKKVSAQRREQNINAQRKYRHRLRTERQQLLELSASIGSRCPPPSPRPGTAITNHHHLLLLRGYRARTAHARTKRLYSEQMFAFG